MKSFISNEWGKFSFPKNSAQSIVWSRIFGKTDKLHWIASHFLFREDWLALYCAFHIEIYDTMLDKIQIFCPGCIFYFHFFLKQTLGKTKSSKFPIWSAVLKCCVEIAFQLKLCIPFQFRLSKYYCLGLQQTSMFKVESHSPNPEAEMDRAKRPEEFSGFRLQLSFE